MAPAPASHALQFFGVTLIGVTPENGRKLLLSLAVVVLVPLVGWRLARLIHVLSRHARGVKDAMSREILARLKEAGIGIASVTYEIVGRRS